MADDLLRLQRVAAGRWRYIEARSPLDLLAMRALNFSALRAGPEFMVRPGIVTEIEP